MLRTDSLGSTYAEQFNCNVLCWNGNKSRYLYKRALEHIKFVSHREPGYPDGIQLKYVIFAKLAYKLIFNIKYIDLPLYINDLDKDTIYYYRWRLKIGR